MEKLKSKKLLGNIEYVKTTYHELGFQLSDATIESPNYELLEKYNQQGDLVERSFNSFNLGKTVIKHGIIEWEKETPRSEYKKWHYKYDEKNRRIEEYQENFDNTIPYKRTFKYFDEAKKIETFELSYDNLKHRKKVETYNSNGFIIEDVNYDQNNRFLSKETNLYNENNTILEKYYTENIKSIGQKNSITKFNEKNLIIEIIYLNKFEIPRDMTTYEYDEYGNIILENQYNPIGKLYLSFKYIYEYDNQKNWIKKIEIGRKECYNVTLREIKYY